MLEHIGSVPAVELDLLPEIDVEGDDCEGGHTCDSDDELCSSGCSRTGSVSEEEPARLFHATPATARGPKSRCSRQPSNLAAFTTDEQYVSALAFCRSELQGINACSALVARRHAYRP